MLRFCVLSWDHHMISKSQDNAIININISRQTQRKKHHCIYHYMLVLHHCVKCIGNTSKPYFCQFDALKQVKINLKEASV